jgi:hypothetical protein
MFGKLLERLKNSKVFGISAIYIVAAIFLICAIWATSYFLKEKEAKTEKTNQANIELQQMQDSAISQQIWRRQNTYVNGRDTTYSITMLTPDERLAEFKKTDQYKKKLKETLKIEAESPTLAHKLTIWFASAIISALAVTLVIFLMMNFNIKKEFIHLAVKMAPWIYIANLVTLTAMFLFFE